MEQEGRADQGVFYALDDDLFVGHQVGDADGDVGHILDSPHATSAPGSSAAGKQAHRLIVSPKECVRTAPLSASCGCVASAAEARCVGPGRRGSRGTRPRAGTPPRGSGPAPCSPPAQTFVSRMRLDVKWDKVGGDAAGGGGRGEWSGV
eukprot:3615308-Rhodomonas_salina.2